MTRERVIQGFGWLLLIFAACLASVSGTIAWIAEANPPVREWVSADENRRLNAMNSQAGLLPPIVALCYVVVCAWMATGVLPGVSSRASTDFGMIRRASGLTLFVIWCCVMWMTGRSAAILFDLLIAHTNGPLTNSVAFGSLSSPLGIAGLTSCVLAGSCLPTPSAQTPMDAIADLDRAAKGRIDWLMYTAGRLIRRATRTP